MNRKGKGEIGIKSEAQISKGGGGGRQAWFRVMVGKFVGEGAPNATSFHVTHYFSFSFFLFYILGLLRYKLYL